MKEKLITFETAELAKEKGFDELIKTLYITDRGNTRLAKANNSGRTNSNYIEREDYKVYSAPTQSLLQKWLREVHEIHININTFYFEDLEKYGYEVEDIIHKDGWVVMSNTAGTYEEALEKGLQEGLKLI